MNFSHCLKKIASNIEAGKEHTPMLTKLVENPNELLENPELISQFEQVYGKLSDTDKLTLQQRLLGQKFLSKLSEKVKQNANIDLNLDMTSIVNNAPQKEQ